MRNLSAHLVDRSMHPVLPLRRPAAPGWSLVGTLGVLAITSLVSYVVGFGAYGFVVGAGEYLDAHAEVAPCDNPASRFGWAYEAINYDEADDARLLAITPDPSSCGYQGTLAGTEVTSPVRVEVCPGAGHGRVAEVCGTAWTGWVQEFLVEHIPLPKGGPTRW